MDNRVSRHTLGGNTYPVPTRCNYYGRAKLMTVVELGKVHTVFHQIHVMCCSYESLSDLWWQYTMFVSTNLRKRSPSTWPRQFVPSKSHCTTSQPCAKLKKNSNHSSYHRSFSCAQIAQLPVIPPEHPLVIKDGPPCSITGKP